MTGYSTKPKKPIVLKILTAGEGGVGKTTLLRRYLEGTFITETKMTIGVEFFLKEKSLDGVDYLLQLWDFGGQERFRFLLESYVLGARAALLMFDLTRPITLENLDQWVEIVRSDNPNLPILFIGTKSDLDNYVLVEESYAREFVGKYDLIDYIIVSSKTGKNVEDVFSIILEALVKKP